LTNVAIIIPAMNEAATVPRLARLPSVLDPPPAEIVLVDGGSGDGTPDIARAAGLRVVEHHERGRSRQINRGVKGVSSPFICTSTPTLFSLTMRGRDPPHAR
jgi:glycosyltransferase involved in cell wall biosynthesis